MDGDAEAFLDAMIHHHQVVQKSKGTMESKPDSTSKTTVGADVLRAEQVEVETNAFTSIAFAPCRSSKLGHVSG